jgi:hypothetical protein
MSEPILILRRAAVSRKGGDWDESDYDVFDGERCVGRVYQVTTSRARKLVLGCELRSDPPQELWVRGNAGRGQSGVPEGIRGMERWLRLTYCNHPAMPVCKRGLPHSLRVTPND